MHVNKLFQSHLIRHTLLFLVDHLRGKIRPRIARVYIVPPARGFLESAETFISEARGGALSFPGFNGVLSVLTWVKMRLYLMFFSAVFEDSATRKGTEIPIFCIWSCVAVVTV